MFVGIRLAKVGYYNGDPLKVIAARVDIVQAILEYETFEADYDKAAAALNKPN